MARREKLLPQNLEAEESVLGSILIEPASIVEVLEMLKPEYFYREAHRSIYEGMVSLYNRTVPVDLVTLCDELTRKDKLEEIGGAGYITSLINCVPSSIRIEHYAAIVVQNWRLRALIQGAADIAALAYEQEPTAYVEAEKIIYQIGQGTMGKPIANHREAMDRYMEHLEELNAQHNSGTLSGLPTGSPKLNALLGGWRPSKMTVIAARPNEGKTALALTFADGVVRRGGNVLFFSLEMEEPELMQRWMAMEAKVDSTKLRDGTLSGVPDEQGKTEWERVMEARDRLDNLPGNLWIDDTPDNTDLGIRSKSLRMHAQHGIDLIIVDYLQFVQVDKSDGRRFEKRQLEVAEISHNLKNLARELKVPLIALAQLNRESDDRADRRPQMSDIRECGNIEQDMDAGLFIWKDPNIPVDQTEYDITLLVLKNRNGSKGEVKMHFVGSYTKFYPVQDY